PAHSMNRPSPTTFGSFVKRSRGRSSFCCRRASAWCVILRPLTVDGRISMPRTQRGSVRPVGTVGLHHTSCATAGIVYGGDLMIRSGGPYLSASCHLLSSGHCLGGGMSLGSSYGAPAPNNRCYVAFCNL